MARCLLSVCSILLFLVVLAAARDYTNHTTMDDGNYKLWWSFENATDTFYFKVEVKAKGWIGFGFSLLDSESWMRDAMEKYDVLVGGVFDNASVYSEDYLTEYLNTTQAPDHIDKINNWVITSGKEEGGNTILEFSRKRVTNDTMSNEIPIKGDIALTPGLRYFVWAYHELLDTPYLDNTSYIHTKSGREPVMLIKEVEHDTIHVTYEPPKRDYKGGDSSIPVMSTLTFICGMIFSVLALV